MKVCLHESYKLTEYFYPSGNTSIVIIDSFNTDKIYHSEFYEDGTKKGVGVYLNGKQDSIWTWYYPNGTIKAIDSWVNGKSLGEQKKFDQEGKLKEFFFNKFNKTAYYAYYANTGVIEKDSGSPIITLINNDTITLEGTAKSTFIFSSPPTIKPKEFIITIYKEDNSILSDTIKKFITNFYGKKVNYSYTPKSSGNYYVVGELISSNKRMGFSDTVRYYTSRKIRNTGKARLNDI